MRSLTRTMHRETPTVAVVDPRGLAVRVVDYHRASASDTAEAQVNHTAHDPQGRASTLRDPRLFLDASSPANLSTIHSLTGAVVCTVSVDAGLRLGLLGEAGQPVENWDGRGSRRQMQYDGQLRLTALYEQVQDGEDVCAERLSYAANDPAAADHNQCGRLTRHDDPAGTLHFIHYGLTGSVLEHRRHFIDAPVTGFTTSVRLSPLGESLSRTDALGNEQQFAQSLAGHLRSVWLRLSDTTEQTLIVKAIHYNAQDQVEKEVAGNGVVTRLEYCAQSGRLTRLLSQLDQHTPLQDLQYAYDPVGNVSSIEDAALPVRYFANQRIEPLNQYRYDSLYRLIDATGWEAGGVDHGPASRASTDPAMPGNYRQTYRYDLGNNLLELIHVGPQNHGHRLIADRHSNRCLPVRNGIDPTEQDFRDSFDANGNLRVLHPGQTLSWNLRNQLREVRPVERDGGPSDSEQYAYGADGLRVRKTRSLQTSAQSLLIETLYLPGLEVRTHSGTGEILHIVEINTGHGSVRVLHWQAGQPEGIANDQQRYSLTDHLGSSTLELDQDGQVITQERYYPFGETAWSSGDAVQVSCKTLRYSGKERDATQLYYYGFRYYVPWLQRWLSADPSGNVEGLNLFRMLKNSPINNRDPDGGTSYDVLNEEETAQIQNYDAQMIHHGIDHFSTNARVSVETALSFVESWSGETIAALESNNLDSFTRHIMEFSFGIDFDLEENDPRELIRQLTRSMRELRSYVAGLKSGEGWRVSLVDTKESRFYGNTISTATQGNLIWLNRSSVEEVHPVALAKVLAHESFHAMRSFSSNNFINDFWYLGRPVPSRNASDAEVDEYIFGVEYSSLRVENARGPIQPPSEEDMAPGPRRHFIGLIDRLLNHAGEPASASSAERAEIYQEQAAVRQSAVLQNADSLAMILMARYKRS